MKKIMIIAGALAAMLSISSCTKFLTEDPKTFFSSDTYFADEAQMQAIVNGLYSPVSNIYFDGIVAPNHNNFIMLETITGYHKRNHPYDSQILGYTLPLTDDNPMMSNNWNDTYNLIGRANTAIKGISESNAAVDEKVRNRLLGESYFMRAYAYFFLVQLYGPVPMPLLPAAGKSDIVKELTSISLVYKQIESDLLKAEELMKDLPWHTGDGHISKGAVKSLMAKVYLAMAGYPLQQTDCYKKSYDKAKEVVASGAYTAFASINDIAKPENQNKMEAIFCSQQDTELAQSGLHMMMLPFYEGWSGAQFSEKQEMGGALVPSRSFINSYDEADLRGMEGGYFYNSYNGVDFPQPFSFKYFDPQAVSSGKSAIPFYYLRYSDILLVLAEAACGGKGSTSDSAAIDAYQVVRGRAVPGSAKPSSLKWEDIYKERVWELCYEDQAWFDILRTHKIFNVLKGTVVNAIGFAPNERPDFPLSETDLLFPYPKDEKRLNENLSLTYEQRMSLN